VHDRDAASGQTYPAPYYSSSGVVLACVLTESLEFIRVDGSHHSRREHALKQAADPARARQLAGDLPE
jgi:hypothetical protein